MVSAGLPPLLNPRRQALLCWITNEKLSPASAGLFLWPACAKMQRACRSLSETPGRHHVSGGSWPASLPLPAPPGLRAGAELRRSSSIARRASLRRNAAVTQRGRRCDNCLGAPGGNFFVAPQAYPERPAPPRPSPLPHSEIPMQADPDDKPERGAEDDGEHAVAVSHRCLIRAQSPCGGACATDVFKP